MIQNPEESKDFSGFFLFFFFVQNFLRKFLNIFLTKNGDCVGVETRNSNNHTRAYGFGRKVPPYFPFA